MKRSPKQGTPPTSTATAPEAVPPVRWSAGGSPTPIEAQAGLLLRQAIERQPIGDAQLAAIEKRLNTPPRRRSMTLAWQVAVGAALVLSGGALVGAATHFLRQERVLERKAPAVPRQDEPPAPRSSTRPHKAATPSPEAPPDMPAPPATPDAPSAAGEHGAGATPRLALAAPKRRTPPTDAPAAAANPQPSALAREARRLADALRTLRQEGDPAAALVLLDKVGAEGPDPTFLTAETNAARIEALLRLHRNDEALSLLDAMKLRARGLDRERLVARGELRARAHRSADAVADFDLLLSDGPSLPRDVVTERALFGRASCHAQRQDQPAARADLVRYLALFPGGRFAGAARTALLPRATP